jgi:hypothetical protein
MCKEFGVKAYKILDGRLLGKRTAGTSRRRLKDSVKWISEN